METRANNALIGLFTLVVVAAAVAFVMWFARAADSNKVDQYRVVFTGSVTGLSVGSNVLLNGIRVGQVDTLEVSPTDPTRVVGRISVKDSTPIKTDTRARMEFQGLTGSAYVQLYGGTSGAPALEPPKNEALATIVAERSELQNLVDGARDTINQASQTLQRVDDLLRANQGHISDTAASIDDFTKALASNSNNISNFLASVGKASTSISQVADSVNGMTGRAQDILNAVDPQRINRAVDNIASASDQLAASVKAIDANRINQTIGNVSSFAQTLADSRGSLSSFARNAADLSERLNGTAPKLDASLDQINRITASVDSAKVRSVVDNVASASTQLAETAKALDATRINQTIGNVSAFSQTLADSRENLSTFARNAADVSNQLSAVAPKLDASLDQINRITASVDSAKVNSVVNNVDRVTAAVAANADDISAFIKDARKVSGDLASVTPKFDQTVDSVNRITSGIDAAQVAHAVDNIDRFATTLGNNTEKVRGFIDDASDVGRKINASADRLDAILQNVTTMTSSQQSQGMFSEITKAAESVRKLADNLNTRTADIAKNVSAFSGSGLRDYQNLAVQGTAAVRDLQRTINSLQRNPSQLIFGGKSNIPTYGGQ